MRLEAPRQTVTSSYVNTELTLRLPRDLLWIFFCGNFITRVESFFWPSRPRSICWLKINRRCCGDS